MYFFIIHIVSGQIITTSAEVTLNGGLVRESPQNPLNSGLGIILVCPEYWQTERFSFLHWTKSRYGSKTFFWDWFRLAEAKGPGEKWKVGPQYEVKQLIGTSVRRFQPHSGLDAVGWFGWEPGWGWIFSMVFFHGLGWILYIFMGACEKTPHTSCGDMGVWPPNLGALLITWVSSQSHQSGAFWILNHVEILTV